MIEVEVRGAYVTADGSPAGGSVAFTPRIVAAHGATAVVTGLRVTVTLDALGTFAVDLQATDDPDLSPVGWTYCVEEQIGGRGLRSYDIEVPAAAAGAGIDLVDVAPASAASGDPSVFPTLAALAAETAARTAGLAAETAARIAADALLQPLATAVTSVAGRTGAVTIAESDVSGLVADLAARSPRGNGFVALGDSISCSSIAGTAGGGYGQAWGHMVSVLSQQRLLYLGNGGVSGNNSTQILARVPGVIALGPQIVTVLAGTNDLSQSVPFATWSANIKLIAAQLRAAGIRAVLCTLPPRDATMTATTATTLVWNRWLKTWARQNAYDVLDFHALLTDPTTGLWAAGMGLDSVHPSGAGHVAMAQYAVAQLAPSLPTYSPIQAATALDADNLVLNPLLTAGTPTPTSWTAGGTGGITGFTESLQTDADFAGKAWEWDVLNPSAGFRQLASFAISGSSWSVGETLLFTCKIKVLTNTNVTPGLGVGVKPFPYFVGSATPTVSLTQGQSEITSPAAGLLWFTHVVPASTTSIQFTALCNGLPSNAVFKARIGQFGIFNLSRLGLAPAA